MPAQRPRGLSKAERLFLRRLDPAPKSEVVDLSYGDQDLALAVAGLVPNGHVTLLTHDATLAAAVESALRGAGVANVAVVVAAGATSLPALHFDLAYLAVQPYLSAAQLTDLLAGARRSLKLGGRLILFAGMRQGAPTLLRRAEQIFGNLEVLDKSGGTRIARCIQQADSGDAGVAEVEVREPQADALFAVSVRGHDFILLSDSGVFSYGALDEGTRLLLESVEVRPTDRVVDIGCGYGAIGIVAARLAPEGFVTMVDTDARAVDLARRNAARNGVINAEVLVSDGSRAAGERGFDLVLSNPPLHASPGTIRRLTAEAYGKLAPGGRLAYVVHKAYDARPIIENVFGEVSTLAENEAFRVIGATRQDVPLKKDAG